MAAACNAFQVDDPGRVAFRPRISNLQPGRQRCPLIGGGLNDDLARWIVKRQCQAVVGEHRRCDLRDTRKNLPNIEHGCEGSQQFVGRLDVPHDDAATAVAAALTLPVGIYNAVDDEPMTHRAFVDSLAEALGVRAPKLLPTWITPLFGSLGALASRSLRISNQKLRLASGWTPRYSNVRQGWGAVVAQLGTEPQLIQDLARPVKHRGE